MRTDVLVIGAGPVGLSLAIGLRQHGMSVRIVDQRHGPMAEPRAAVIWPRGAEAFEDLGVGPALRQAANELCTLHIHSRGHRLGTVRLGQLPSAFPKPLLIEQHVTERILAAHLASLGTKVEWATMAADIQLAPDGALVTLRRDVAQQEAASCSWLVGCDGAHSFVRSALGIEFPGSPTANLQIIQADAVPRWHFPADRSEGYYFLARRACLGCFPVADGAYRFFCYTNGSSSDQRPPSVAEMQNLIAGIAGAPELRLEKVTWLNRANFQTRFAAKLRVGRALLAGDAAHVWPSLGGHGMNIGLQGAHNLAWKLAAVHLGHAPDGLLDTYETEERHAVTRFLRLMRLNLLERPSRPGGLLPRELALRLGLRLPSVSRTVERAASDLSVDHRHSALSHGSAHRLAQLDRRKKLRPGDRMPDVTVHLPATGRSARLHTLLTYQRWTLLLPIGLEEPLHSPLRAILKPWRSHLQEVTVARDASFISTKLTSRTNQLILVRPDRYIGLVTCQNDLTSLRRYLEQWLGGAEAQDGSFSRKTLQEEARASCAV